MLEKQKASEQARNLVSKIHSEKNAVERQRMTQELRDLAKQAREQAKSNVIAKTKTDLHQLNQASKEGKAKPAAPTHAERFTKARQKVQDAKTETQSYIESTRRGMSYWQKVKAGDANIMAGKTKEEKAELLQRADRMIKGTTENVNRYGEKLREVEKSEQGIALMEGQAKALNGKNKDAEARLARAEHIAQNTLSSQDIHTDVVVSRQLRKVTERIGDQQAKDAILRSSRDMKLTQADKATIQEITRLSQKTDAESQKQLSSLVTGYTEVLNLRRVHEYDLTNDALSFQFRSGGSPRLSVDGKIYEVDALSQKVFALNQSGKRTGELSGEALTKVKTAILDGRETREKEAKDAYHTWWNEVKALGDTAYGTRELRELRMQAMKNVFDRTSPFAELNKEQLDAEMNDLIAKLRISARAEKMSVNLDTSYSALLARAGTEGAVALSNKEAFHKDILKTTQAAVNLDDVARYTAWENLAKKYHLSLDDLAKYTTAAAPAIGISTALAGKVLVGSIFSGTMNTVAGVNFWQDALKNPGKIAANLWDLTLDIAPISGTKREYDRAQAAFEAGDTTAGYLHSGFYVLSGGIDAVTLVPAATGFLALPALLANVAIKTPLLLITKTGVKLMSKTLGKEALEVVAKQGVPAGAEAAAKKFSISALKTATGKTKSAAVEVGKVILKDTVQTTTNILTLGVKDWKTVYTMAKQGKVVTPQAARLTTNLVKQQKIAAGESYPTPVLLDSTKGNNAPAALSAATMEAHLPHSSSAMSLEANVPASLSGKMGENELSSIPTRLYEGVQSQDNLSRLEKKRTISDDDLVKEYLNSGHRRNFETSPQQSDPLLQTKDQTDRKGKNDFEERLKQAKEKREREERMEYENKAKDEFAKKEAEKQERQRVEQEAKDLLKSDPDARRIQRIKKEGLDNDLVKAREVLGVGKNASKEDVKKAYRKLQKKFHTDKLNNATETSKQSLTDIANKLNIAYGRIQKEFAQRNTVGV